MSRKSATYGAGFIPAAATWNFFDSTCSGTFLSRQNIQANDQLECEIRFEYLTIELARAAIGPVQNLTNISFDGLLDFENMPKVLHDDMQEDATPYSDNIIAKNPVIIVEGNTARATYRVAYTFRQPDGTFTEIPEFYYTTNFEKDPSGRWHSTGTEEASNAVVNRINDSSIFPKLGELI